MAPGDAGPSARSVSGAVAAPYVLAWRLAGRKVVVVGGGAIGTAKVELLLATGADIVVVDPTPSARVLDLADSGRLKVRVRRARPTDLAGARLLVAATGDSATNRRLRRWARPFGAVVNAVDDVANCDVTVPAMIRRGPATIAITTQGASPAGARFLREELTATVDRALPTALADVFDEAARVRHDLRASGHYRYDYRSWRQLFFEPALEAVRRDRGHAIPELGRRLRAAFEPVSTDDRAHTDHEASLPPGGAGKVTLVGAGPGGADLITVRGARALAAADVVLYDRLADPELLDLAPPAAERIPVGKGKGFGHTQAEINALLVGRACEGSHVVRLKGGDPFVFGRGSEEVDACAAAGLSVEVIPGVSSAVAAPALAGIPVTDRRAAASFTVVTGHRAGDRAESTRWQALARSGDTIVVLMAASTASEVAAALSAGGRQADEPVAFVHKAATPDQRVVRSTLAEALRDGCPLPAPTVMVVGAVADRSTVGHVPPASPPIAATVNVEESSISTL